MPDSTIIIAAIQSHSAALNGALRRHAANAGRCKVWSTGIVAGWIVFATGRTQMAALPWAAATVVLLALADAGQSAMARVFTDAYNRFMQKLPLNGGNAMKAEDAFALPPLELGWRQAGLVLRVLGSFSVWPFYGALLAVVVAFHIETSPPKAIASTAKAAGCAAGGGCGTTGGCGSGGCGASSGKGCGCGSGTATKAAQPVNTKSQPVPTSLQKAGGVAGAPGVKGPQTVTKSLQLKQGEALSPVRLATPPPGVRLPPAPQNRFPATRPPGQSAAPLKAQEAGGTPALQNGPPIPVVPIQGAGSPGAAVPAPDSAPAPAPVPGMPQ